MIKEFKVKKNQGQLFVVKMNGGPKDLNDYTIESIHYNLEKAQAEANRLNDEANSEPSYPRR